MIKLKSFLLLLSMFSVCSSGCQENNRSPRQDSQLTAFENMDFSQQGLPDTLNYVDTSTGWDQPGQKILLRGRVLKPDGKTPAGGVLLYYYHTNTEGRYVHRPEVERSMPPNQLGQTHGYIRGWIKTDDQGRYALYTVRPGSYPAGDDPAHVHVTVQEPREIMEYYIDDFTFDDDELLTPAKRKRMENRAGSGIVKLFPEGNLMVGERDIILGLNIPGYRPIIQP